MRLSFSLIGHHGTAALYLSGLEKMVPFSGGSEHCAAA